VDELDDCGLLPVIRHEVLDGLEEVSVFHTVAFSSFQTIRATFTGIFFYRIDQQPTLSMHTQRAMAVFVYSL
jgi:hypothetical protein